MQRSPSASMPSCSIPTAAVYSNPVITSLKYGNGFLGRSARIVGHQQPRLVAQHIASACC